MRWDSSVIMPMEEDHSGQPVWLSVILFTCKGMIEGIIVLLFLWLLVEVLFTKHLEVHLQILLSVGLVMLCFTLILGCVICWCNVRHKPTENKLTLTPSPPGPGGHMMVERTPSLSSGTLSTKMQYEELEGEVLENPSVFEGSTPSDEEFTVSSEITKQNLCFQMRRLSSPVVSTPLYRPISSGRSSLPSFSKLSFLTKTRNVLEHHSRQSGDSHSTGEHELSVPRSQSPCSLSSLQTKGLLQEEPAIFNYGSYSCNETLNPFLHFTLTFSSTQNNLSVSLVGISGLVHHCLEDVFVQGSLPPLWPGPLDFSAQDGTTSSGLHKKPLVVNVGSLEGLKSCILRLAVFTQDNPNKSLIGELEVSCNSLEWTPDRPLTCMKELRRAQEKPEQIS